MKYCKVCGKEITNKSSKNVKYCSEKCRREFEKKKYIKKIAQRNNRMQVVRNDIQRYYKHQCAICGWKATEDINTLSNGCEVHHIIPCSQGGTETRDNLILLCPNHHKLAHLGLLDTKTLQKYLVTDEEIKKMEFEARSRCADRIAEAIFGWEYREKENV